MMMRWLLVVCLLCYTATVNALTRTCSVEEATDDECPRQFRLNGQCDNENRCDTTSDCYDCSPCAAFQNDPQACINANCSYCWELQLCADDTISTLFSTSCHFTRNYDPCMRYRFDGCQVCTSVPGCQWCGKDAVCTSSVVTDERRQCTASDYLSNCTRSLDTPLDDAREWIYRLIQIRPVWESGIDGTGVTIRINDQGLDVAHPDFAGRFDLTSSCSASLPIINDRFHNHGTAVASIAAGDGACGRGIAPGATLSSCQILPVLPGESVAAEFQNFAFLYKQMERVDISSNSWGRTSCRTIVSDRRRRLQNGVCPFQSETTDSPCNTCTVEALVSMTDFDDCRLAIASYCASLINYDLDRAACDEYLYSYSYCYYNNELTTAQLASLERGIRDGRNGLGVIYVLASGNSKLAGSNVNMDALSQSRYTITVGSVDKRGQHSTYSVPGASLLVSAPGGNTARDFANFPVALSGGGCIEAGSGTSYATPIVSGIVALMLQVNPSLTWRDVQGILVTTSIPSDQTDPSWSQNAVGLFHSPYYGFGIVNAIAAVNSARRWTNYASEQMVNATSGLINADIPDYRQGLVRTLVTVDMSLTTETVVVELDLRHSSRGDLLITLSSPSGTPAVLHESGRADFTPIDSKEAWTLSSVATWGENAQGNWVLFVSDQRPSDLRRCSDLKWDWPSRTSNGFGCEALERYCTNNTVNPLFTGRFGENARLTDDLFFDQTSNLTPEKACCSCGGGQRSKELDDVLISWTLKVYGRSWEGNANEEDPGINPVPPSWGESPTTPASTATSASGTLAPIGLLMWLLWMTGLWCRIWL